MIKERYVRFYISKYLLPKKFSLFLAVVVKTEAAWPLLGSSQRFTESHGRNSSFCGLRHCLLGVSLRQHEEHWQWVKTGTLVTEQTGNWHTTIWSPGWVTHQTASLLLHLCRLKRLTAGRTTKTYLRVLSRNKMISFLTPGCRGGKAGASLPSPLTLVLLNPGMPQHRELAGPVLGEFGALFKQCWKAVFVDCKLEFWWTTGTQLPV